MINVDLSLRKYYEICARIFVLPWFVSMFREGGAATRIFVETNVRFDRISTKLVLDNVVVFIHAGNRIVRGDTFLSFEFFWEDYFCFLGRSVCADD